MAFPFASLLTSVTLSLSLFATSAFAVNVTATEFAQTSFDYLIVGGGNAGLVVAARLSEDPSKTVGVIEAGWFHENDPLVDDAAQYGVGFNNSDYDWAFLTVPQPGLQGRQIQENRGKLLGGSSALNAFAFHRPSAAEFDTWGSTFGNGDLWTWENIEPYFKKAENWTSPPPLVWPGAEASEGLALAHGRDGPIEISYNSFYPEELGAAVEAASTLGFALNNDPVSGNGAGFQNVPHTIHPTTGKRTYAATGYWVPFQDRPNYVLLERATVSKVNFDVSTKDSGEGLEATGVSFVTDGQTFAVNASEVILSAGALQTPQLLELSGIGNTTLLSSLGIETLLDLPYVGENFFDHTITFSDSVDEAGQITLDNLRWDPAYLAEQQAIFQTNHTGALSYSSAAIAVVPAKTWVEADILDEMKASLDSTIGHRTPLAKLQYQDSLDLLEGGKVGWGMLVAWPGGGQASQVANGTNYFGHHVLNYRPFSRGFVHINSADINEAPLIDPDFFGVDFDAKFCAHQLEWTQKLTNTAPLSDIVAGPNVPSADQLSIEGLEQYCRTRAGTTWHPMGSTAMAPLELGGVVSNQLIVHGTRNLRVVDAGIVPQTIGAAPQATTYMIAEKAADIIKGLFA